MLLIEKANWITERNLDRDLSLDALAKACGVSRFHLAHAFGDATGRPVMGHIRARRLSQAASRLASESSDILETALSAGYGSHEAFSRAFKNCFGVTPDAVKKARSIEGIAVAGPLSLGEIGEVALASPRLERQGPMLFVGLEAKQRVEDRQVLARQWGTFMARFSEIEDVIDPAPWACVASSMKRGHSPTAALRLSLTRRACRPA